jgi:hypothetical protein
MATKTNIYSIEFYNDEGESAHVSIDFTNKEIAKHYYLSMKEHNPKTFNIDYWKCGSDRQGLINEAKENDNTLTPDKNYEDDEIVYFTIYYIDYNETCSKNILVELKLPVRIAQQLQDCNIDYTDSDEICVSVSFDSYKN